MFLNGFSGKGRRPAIRCVNPLEWRINKIAFSPRENEAVVAFRAGVRTRVKIEVKLRIQNLVQIGRNTPKFFRRHGHIAPLLLPFHSSKGRPCSGTQSFCAFTVPFAHPGHPIFTQLFSPLVERHGRQVEMEGIGKWDFLRLPKASHSFFQPDIPIRQMGNFLAHVLPSFFVYDMAATNERGTRFIS